MLPGKKTHLYMCSSMQIPKQDIYSTVPSLLLQVYNIHFFPFFINNPTISLNKKPASIQLRETIFRSRKHFVPLKGVMVVCIHCKHTVEMVLSPLLIKSPILQQDSSFAYLKTNAICCCSISEFIKIGISVECYLTTSKLLKH